MTGSVVTGVTITSGGGGYTSSPTVALSAGTTVSGNASATSAISTGAGQVVSATITAGGNYPSGAPTVAFAAPTSGVTATGTANIVNNLLASITITNPGSGYASPPAITIGAGVSSDAVTLTSAPVVGDLAGLTTGIPFQDIGLVTLLVRPAAALAYKPVDPTWWKVHGDPNGTFYGGLDDVFCLDVDNGVVYLRDSTQAQLWTRMGALLRP
jgi:hypothetical protein